MLWNHYKTAIKKKIIPSLCISIEIILLKEAVILTYLVFAFYSYPFFWIYAMLSFTTVFISDIPHISHPVRAETGNSKIMRRNGKNRMNYHRIIEWPGLKRTTMIIEFQSSCCVQGHQPPDQAAQSHIHPGLECLQGWGIHNLLGQPVPLRHHPLCEKIPPNL